MTRKKPRHNIITPMGPDHPATRDDTSIRDCLVFDLKELRRAVKHVGRLLTKLKREEHAQLCDEAGDVLFRQISAFEWFTSSPDDRHFSQRSVDRRTSRTSEIIDVTKA